MDIFTVEKIEGLPIKKVFGLVRAGSVRSRDYGRDLLGTFKDIAGGEIEEYTKMVADTREQAIQRLKDDAKKLGANAIVGFRIEITTIGNTSAISVAVYGTAVEI